MATACKTVFESIILFKKVRNESLECSNFGIIWVQINITTLEVFSTSDIIIVNSSRFWL